MDETETQNDAQATSSAAAESTQAEPSPAERATAGIDLANRPEAAWLDTVEGEIDDVDLVLKCLARDSAKMCQTCDAATTSGELEARPMLARCASTKQPR